MKQCRRLRGANVSEGLVVSVFMVKAGMLICVIMIALGLAYSV